jgi:2-polyprenyl-3-methyl-5-hydroxy-6-metoxy-1,4-benzoquinol methylase
MSNHQRPLSHYTLSDTVEGYKEIFPKPGQAELQSYYHDKYYQLGLGSYEVQYSESELLYFQNRLDRFFRLVHTHLAWDSSPHLLDIGCGEGFTSAYFARKGFTVNSIDYSSQGILEQNPQVLANHEVGDIFELLNLKIKANIRFDVLILQNVLEHVIDPRNLCDMMQKLLKPSGLALVTVPNDFSLTQLSALGEGFIDNEFWVSPPDHLNYFNTHSLTEFLGSQGFDILDMIADFPVDWFLFNECSNYVKDQAKGKQAHLARIFIENMLHQAPLDKVINFYRAAASLGIGRDITVVVSKKIFEGNTSAIEER